MGWFGPALVDRYRVAGVRAILVLSDINRTYQEHMFPGLPVFQLRLAIDEALFHHDEAKRPRIAFMPRRGKRDAEMLIGMLRNQGLLDGFDVIPIDGMSEARVAETLRESLCFLALSSREGFGLPAAEAMACGCIVVGYTGHGGDEFFDPDHTFPIEDGNLLEFSSAIEHILSLYREDPGFLDAMGRRASKKILGKYGRSLAEEENLAQWTALLRDHFGAP
jgi:glycosyltransferase involved in cell wall biosynthesis